jgi:hypothetical protein
VYEVKVESFRGSAAMLWEKTLPFPHGRERFSGYARHVSDFAGNSGTEKILKCSHPLTLRA